MVQMAGVHDPQDCLPPMPEFTIVQSRIWELLKTGATPDEVKRAIGITSVEYETELDAMATVGTYSYIVDDYDFDDQE
jgi:hypothetical protein